VCLFSRCVRRYLGVSFIHETRFLAIQGEELEEAEIPGFDSKTNSLFCGNVLHNGAVQVRRTLPAIPF
jgi:DNA damage-binding protein 1